MPLHNTGVWKGKLAGLLPTVGQLDLHDFIMLEHVFPSDLARQAHLVHQIGRIHQINAPQNLSIHQSYQVTQTPQPPPTSPLTNAAINTRSGAASESGLVFWLCQKWYPSAPFLEKMRTLRPGWNYIRHEDGLNLIGNIIGCHGAGEIVPPGATILEYVEHFVQTAMDRGTTAYVFGQRCGTGIRNIHVNQGSSGQWDGDNGKNSDGCVLIPFSDGTWGVLALAFTGQTVASSWYGFPTGDTLLSQVLSPALPSPAGADYEGLIPRVGIVALKLGDSRTDHRVDLSNMTAQGMSITGWKVVASDGKYCTITTNRVLPAAGGRFSEVLTSEVLSGCATQLILMDASNGVWDTVYFNQTDRERFGGLIYFGRCPSWRKYESLTRQA